MMSPQVLDSRTSLGSDLERLRPRTYDYLETSSHYANWTVKRTVRVVLGRLGNVVRLTASELDIVADGGTIEEVWAAFLDQVSKRQDTAWMTFDLGPTRPEEIDEGLDIPGDEDWAEPVGPPGGS